MFVHACMCVCECVYMCVYVCRLKNSPHGCVHAYVHVCVYVSTSVYMYECAYVWMRGGEAVKHHRCCMAGRVDEKDGFQYAGA